MIELHPVGCEVIIIKVDDSEHSPDHGDIVKVGQVWQIGEHVVHQGDPVFFRNGIPGAAPQTAQELVGAKGLIGRLCHPTAWMIRKPNDDEFDEEQTDTIREALTALNDVDGRLVPVMVGE